jgi:ribosomal protein S18 acetylase RimI-like enzyme
MESITLRAATNSDLTFLQTVYANTRMEELAMTGWSDAQKQEFCQMQFRAQDTHYRKHYPNAEYHVIQWEKSDAGRLSIDRQEKEIHLLDLALLPEHRGKGIGTTLLKKFQQEATAARLSLSIYVERFNPALRLYERLGFKHVKDEGVYLFLKWDSPNQPSLT